jgi:hypothetical protein
LRRVITPSSRRVIAPSLVAKSHLRRVIAPSSRRVIAPSFIRLIAPRAKQMTKAKIYILKKNFNLLKIYAITKLMPKACCGIIFVVNNSVVLSLKDNK